MAALFARTRWPRFRNQPASRTGSITFSANMGFASRLFTPFRGIIPDMIMEGGAFMPEKLKTPCNLGLLAHV
jgi:hypothetical protein